LTSVRTPDPIHGFIEIPNWLLEIQDTEPVRRMMFIRQLGLKAYIDFPGAIHTRYAHVLGTMHLANKLINILNKKDVSDGVKDVLCDNKNTIMAAAFLHDVAHGPFSHTVDFVLKRQLNTSHEKISENIIKKFSTLADYSIPLDRVIRIINGNHSFDFISGIMDSQIDIDKLDYLLRDAHNIGYKYSFDLDHFLNFYTVIGDRADLSRCILGLEDNNETIVTAQIFVLIWSGMYELAYYKDKSRIAEKMLEKATLYACDQQENDVKEHFTSIDNYIKLYDDMLLEKLEKLEGYPQMIVKRIKQRNVFNKVIEYDISKLQKDGVSLDDVQIKLLSQNPDKISEEITQKLCDKLNVGKYKIICDIIQSRVPKDIFLDNVDKDNQPIVLRERSPIISNLESNTLIKIYSESSTIKDEIKTQIVGILSDLNDTG
jgi:HD superfamily phosphohydrolase